MINSMKNVTKLSMIMNNLHNYIISSDFDFQSITNISIDPKNLEVRFEFSNDVTLKYLNNSYYEIANKIVDNLMKSLFGSNYYIDHEQDNIDHTIIGYSVVYVNDNEHEPIGTIDFELIEKNVVSFTIEEIVLNGCFKEFENLTFNL